MKALFILMLTMVVTPCLGQSEFNFGGTYSMDEYHYTTGEVGWSLVNLDEGAQVSIEKGQTKFQIRKQQGMIFILAGCGYDPRLGTFDNRTGVFVSVVLPIFIPKNAKVRVETPPNGYVRFTLDTP